MTLFAISATRSETTETGTLTRQIPTFYLNPATQGIRDADDAANIARRILGNFDHDSDAEYFITVAKV